MEVARLIAWFWTPTDIVRRLREVGKSIKEPTVCDYQKAPKWKPIIEKFREDYTKALQEVPLFHKRKRLEELQKHYDLHMSDGKLIRAQSVLRDAREEVEQKKYGDVSFNFTQVNNNEFTEMSDEEIAVEKSKVLDQLERVQKMKKLLENKGETNVGS